MDYILSKDLERMYELVQTGFRPVFRSKFNSELRTYPDFTDRSRESFFDSAEYMEFEFIDPASQEDYAECVNQLHEYKAYTAKAVSSMEKDSAEVGILHELLRDIAQSADPAQIVNLNEYLADLKAKCENAIQTFYAERR